LSYYGFFVECEYKCEDCKRESDRWYIYAERKVGNIRIKDPQKGVRFSELGAIVVDKGELRQGISKFGKKWICRRICQGR